MARGVSSGGGQSSLGYLFGSPEPPQPKLETLLTPSHLINHTTTKDQQAARISDRNSNNYHRADGQNSGNFITDRPSTRVHAEPGGGSSLGYLFGGK
ncbi:unnamed protein product [Sphagnum balticum]